MMSSNWQKVPAVMSGGKQYFFVVRVEDTTYSRVWVAWSRRAQGWSVDALLHQCIPGSRPTVFLGEHKTADAGIRAVESMFTLAPW